MHVDSVHVAYQNLIKKGINIETIKKTDWSGEQLILPINNDIIHTIILRGDWRVDLC